MRPVTMDDRLEETGAALQTMVEGLHQEVIRLRLALRSNRLPFEDDPPPTLDETILAAHLAGVEAVFATTFDAWQNVQKRLAKRRYGMN